MKTGTFNLQASCIEVARDEIEKHIVDEDGEKCFNLFTYLESLANRLDVMFCGDDAPNGRFELDTVAVARYLWCCVSLSHGDSPDGHTFRGMPILD